MPIAPACDIGRRIALAFSYTPGEPRAPDSSHSALIELLNEVPTEALTHTLFAAPRGG
jgi:hypothetical protein